MEMDRFLLLLGLAFRAGKVQVGETPVADALAKGRVRAVFVACDAAPNTRSKIQRRAGPVKVCDLPIPKGELGEALGRESCALAAVTDPGFCDGLLAALTDYENAHQDGGVTP